MQIGCFDRCKRFPRGMVLDHFAPWHPVALRCGTSLQPVIPTECLPGVHWSTPTL